MYLLYLDDNQKADAKSDFSWIAVHARHDVHNRLTHGDYHAEELLSAIEQSAVFGGIADFDDFGASQELHDQTWGDYGRNTELHECASVRGENDTYPIEGIGWVGGHNSK